LSKVKKAFFCKSCGHESPKWVGKCPSCNEWNTFVEEVVQKPTAASSVRIFAKEGETNSKAKLINEISATEVKRIVLKDGEFNRVMGGGIVPGSITLFGGEPGIGKSTLLLQLAVQNKLKVLYVSGEESEQQIKLRAERITGANDSCFVFTETSQTKIFNQINELQPELLIVDSIQTIYSDLIESSPGSISQIKECTAEFLRYAKETNVPVILIGHITKDGSLAGPKVLEHMVDAVLQFEGDRNHTYRLLRTVKNRFGSTNELGIYEMQGDGLREVTNPSEVLISAREEEVSGVAIAATMEGLRPMLIEVQALVSTAAYGTPQRSSTGFDLRRLSMLLAVLEKRCGFRLAAKDVFLNIAGGVKVDDPSIDLAVVCAVLSSNVDMPLEPSICFAAEVGLSGEIRPISRVEQRISEAQKMGYKKIVVSKHNKGLKDNYEGIQVVKVSKIEQVFKALFAQ
jgi:DNA repair protein RadA/Sms